MNNRSADFGKGKRLKEEEEEPVSNTLHESSLHLSDVGGSEHAFFHGQTRTPTYYYTFLHSFSAACVYFNPFVVVNTGAGKKNASLLLLLLPSLLWPGPLMQYS